MPRLFDEIERTDATPATNQEPSFEFLNRVATPWWNEVRELLERWFSEYVAGSEATKAADLRARFRRRDARQHYGAWWELYLYALLRRIYPDSCITVEPERPGHSTRPDFRVSEASAARPLVWVEAVTSSAGIDAEGPGAALEPYVLDTINEVRSSDFRVLVRLRSSAATQPRKQQILRPLRAWLEGLDRADVLAAVEAGRGRPRTTIEARGWVIELEALPKVTGTSSRARRQPHGNGSDAFSTRLGQERATE